MAARGRQLRAPPVPVGRGRAVPLVGGDLRPERMGRGRVRPPGARHRRHLRRAHRQAPFRLRHVPHQAVRASRSSTRRSGATSSREFVDAVRAEGLRVGLYFSLSDWSAPDYPAFTEADKPYRFGYSPPAPGARAVGALPRVHVRADHGAAHATTAASTCCGSTAGGSGRPHSGGGRELIDLIHSLQPDILVNDRLPGFGDFETPEQFVPPRPLGRAWETCMTMNESWGYNPTDTALQVGARADPLALRGGRARAATCCSTSAHAVTGRLPPEQVERLQVVGEWMRRARREHHRHRSRARALAVLRPQHAPRRPRLPSPAHAALRLGHGAGRAHPAGAVGAGAGRPAPSSATPRARASSTR